MTKLYPPQPAKTRIDKDLEEPLLKKRDLCSISSSGFATLEKQEKKVYLSEMKGTPVERAICAELRENNHSSENGIYTLHWRESAWMVESLRSVRSASLSKENESKLPSLLVNARKGSHEECWNALKWEYPPPEQSVAGSKLTQYLHDSVQWTGSSHSQGSLMHSERGETSKSTSSALPGDNGEIDFLRIGGDPYSKSNVSSALPKDGGSPGERRESVSGPDVTVFTNDLTPRSSLPIQWRYSGQPQSERGGTSASFAAPRDGGSSGKWRGHVVDPEVTAFVNAHTPPNPSGPWQYSGPERAETRVSHGKNEEQPRTSKPRRTTESEYLADWVQANPGQPRRHSMLKRVAGRFFSYLQRSVECFKPAHVRAISQLVPANQASMSGSNRSHGSGRTQNLSGQSQGACR